MKKFFLILFIIILPSVIISQSFYITDSIIEFSNFNIDSPSIDVYDYGGGYSITGKQLKSISKNEDIFFRELVSELTKLNFFHIKHLYNSYSINNNYDSYNHKNSPCLDSVRKFQLGLDSCKYRESYNTTGCIYMIMNISNQPLDLKNSVLVTFKQRNMNLKIIVSRP